MSILVLQIPKRQHLRARAVGSGEPEIARATADLTFARSPDGVVLSAEGRSAPALLPKADSVVAVLADADVSWHRITLPKAPAARLRAALGGVLEEALLDDADAVHLAVAPNAVAGQPTWVAAVDRRWLRAELAALEKANVFVDRIVPVSWPDDPPSGHFAEADGERGDLGQAIVLNWSHADGVACLNLQGGLARAVIPASAQLGARWSATPSAAAAAEHWLGKPLNVMPPGQRLLQAARSLWNLRQFDLARRTRGARALRDSLRQFMSTAWRPVRWGLVALAVMQIVGLNAWAWHQRAAIEAKRAAIQALVKSAFPRVSTLDVQRDAAAVMLRESQTLLARAGKPGDTDLETLLQAAASAWPADRPPVSTLRFEPGKLTLSSAGWTDAKVQQFRSQLEPAGLQVDAAEGRLALSRARAGARL